MKHIPLIELCILSVMILIKAVLLHRKGIKVNAFGKTNKTDFWLIPVFCLFVYAALSAFYDLPFPVIVKRTFWENSILYWLAVLICATGLIWFGITLKSFGNSFRIGIDEKTNDKLITTGTFAYSRNPIFVAFIAFFLGIFLAYSTGISLALLLFSIIMIHRQILREETFLKSHYGKEYEDYCTQVRRYL